MPLLDAVVIEPEQPATHSIIWCHGLGADGHDFAALVPELTLGTQHGLRFIFPHAPEIPVTANGGYIMRAWYDILEMSVERRINRQHLGEAVQSIWEWMEHEQQRGIDHQNILLAGFSQGGAVAYQAALNYPKRLAGLLAMSTYIADYDALHHEAANRAIPMLIQHGNFDPVVLTALGRKAHDYLSEQGYAPQWQHYPTEHNLCPEQVTAISHWLRERLGTQPDAAS